MNYAIFLTTFAKALHQVDKKLTVDVASWNPIWNWTLISNSSVDGIFLMDTYTGNAGAMPQSVSFGTHSFAGSFDTFAQRLDKALNQIDINKLGIGLESINPNTNQPFSDQELEERFQLLQEFGVQQIDIWDAPVPDNWYFVFVCQSTCSGGNSLTSLSILRHVPCGFKTNSNEQLVGNFIHLQGFEVLCLHKCKCQHHTYHHDGRCHHECQPPSEFINRPWPQ
jgi:hypothetical protein